MNGLSLVFVCREKILISQSKVTAAGKSDSALTFKAVIVIVGVNVGPKISEILYDFKVTRITVNSGVGSKT